MPTWLRPPLLLAALALLFFVELICHPSEMLYSDYSDLVADHLPEKRFLVRSWQQTGEVPLWCPYTFGGSPFVHDPTIAAFYPPHLPLYLMPEHWLGAALSWLVVIHVMVAGWTMFAYARWQRLEDTGALVAALGYMFSGSWLLHVLGGGHYIVLGLAWLPLVLLWLEQAIHLGSLFRATWAGAAYALITLGTHSQFTFYAGVFIGVWTLISALEKAGYLSAEGPRSWPRTLKALACWIGFGAWMVLIAIGLSAVQLLLTMEATGQSSRTLGVAPRPEMWAGVLQALSALVGPALGGDPAWQWEHRPGLGLLWLALAILAPWLCRQPRRRFQAALCLVWFAVGILGGPFLQYLPVFQLFQLPTRLCLLGTIPVALLAGAAVQSLLADPGQLADRQKRNQRILLLITTLVVVAGMAAVAWLLRLAGEPVHYAPYWFMLLLTVPMAWWLLGRPTIISRRWLGILWCVALVVDLWGISWPMVSVRSPPEIYAPSESVRFLVERKEQRGRVLDVPHPNRSLTMAPLWPSYPVVAEIESLRGFKSLDILRYKEYLQFMTDRDEPLRPLEDPFTRAILGRFPIRNQKLADLLGIRYLVQPSELPLEATVQDKAGLKRWNKVMEDPDPVCFSFMSGDSPKQNAGIQPLSPYTVYENRNILPRAFVVPNAAPLAERDQVLQQLKATDFRRVALLEGFTPSSAAISDDGELEPAEIRQYQPNRIVIDVHRAKTGYLVLTDMWFPGWKAEVDGQPAAIHRANYLFRAIALPAGAREVVLTFDPASYRWGKIVSGCTLALVFLLSIVGLVYSVGRRSAGATSV